MIADLRFLRRWTFRQEVACQIGFRILVRGDNQETFQLAPGVLRRIYLNLLNSKMISKARIMRRLMIHQMLGYLTLKRNLGNSRLREEGKAD